MSRRNYFDSYTGWGRVPITPASSTDQTELKQEPTIDSPADASVESIEPSEIFPNPISEPETKTETEPKPASIQPGSPAGKLSRRALPKGMDTKSILRVDGVSKSFKSGAQIIWAIQKASFEIPKGSLTAIIGPNGSGKSTLLSLMAGLFRPDEGDVIFRHPRHDLISLFGSGQALMSEIRNCQINMIFQNLNLISHLRVWRNVALPLILRGISWRKAWPSAKYWLDKFELLDKANVLPSQLSGGQQQRLAICRAMVANVDLILADEPTARLDKTGTTYLMESFKKITKQTGRTIVLVTHDHGLVREYCDYYLECRKSEQGNEVSSLMISKK